MNGHQEGAGLKFGWGGLGQMRALLIDQKSRWEGGVEGARAVPKVLLSFLSAQSPRAQSP